MENQESQEDLGHAESAVPEKGKAKRSRTRVVLVSSVLVALCIGAGVAIGTFSDPPSVFEQVIEECQLSEKATEGDSGLALDDDGKGLFLDGEGDESSGLSSEEIGCILYGLDVPSSVVSRMDSTNSLMGQQEASWDGIRALWTYHPDNGFDVALELEN
jgi:hypothetical protein